MLDEIGRTLDVIFFFDLDDETAKTRALGRAHEEGRTDDTPESIARRLASTTTRRSRWSSTTARPGSSCRCTRTGPSRKWPTRSRARWLPLERR